MAESASDSNKCNNNKNLRSHMSQKCSAIQFFSLTQFSSMTHDDFHNVRACYFGLEVGVWEHKQLDDVSNQLCYMCWWTEGLWLSLYSKSWRVESNDMWQLHFMSIESTKKKPSLTVYGLSLPPWISSCKLVFVLDVLDIKFFSKNYSCLFKEWQNTKII